MCCIVSIPPERCLCFFDFAAAHQQLPQEVLGLRKVMDRCQNNAIEVPLRPSRPVGLKKPLTNDILPFCNWKKGQHGPATQTTQLRMLPMPLECMLLAKKGMPEASMPSTPWCLDLWFDFLCPSACHHCQVALAHLRQDNGQISMHLRQPRMTNQADEWMDSASNWLLYSCCL